MTHKLSHDSPHLLPRPQGAVSGRNTLRSRFDVLIQTLMGDDDDGDRIHTVYNIVYYM